MRGRSCLAIALIALSILGIVGASAGSAEEDQNIWFELEPDKSAIILVARGQVLGTYFTLYADGEVVDQLRWALDLPFIKQYRVDPGHYEVTTPWLDKPVSIEAKAGKLNILKFEIENGAELRAVLRDAKFEFSGAYLKKAVPFEPEILSASPWEEFSVRGLTPPQLWPIEYIRAKGRTLNFVPRGRPPPPPD